MGRCADERRIAWWRRFAPLSALALFWSLGSLVAQASTLDDASSRCLEAVLRELGWLIEERGMQVQVEAGSPCRRASLAQAQAAGDLYLLLPERIGDDARRRVLRNVLDGQGSQCSYAFKLGDAARRASTRLQENQGYRFNAIQLGWIGFGLRGAQAQGWERFRSFGRGYRPVGGNARALEVFYSGHVRSDCGVGRQVAQIATQRELYGDAAFDGAFSASELSIGTFLTLHDTDSILLGRHAGELFADGKAEKTAVLGRQAFMGAPGFIAHVFDQTYLDDINNQAENFIVVDVSAGAADALAVHGGLAYYDAMNRRIWELARQMPQQSYRRFERLLYERDAGLRANLPPAQQALVAQMLALLDDPFYRGFMVYVHPQGVRPIGYHVARLLDRNPRTPYSIDLTLHNLHTTLYRRWIDSRLDTCEKAAAGTDH
jgi:hypothetical protein